MSYIYLPPETRSGSDDSLLDYCLKNVKWEERTGARREAFWSLLGEPYTYGQGRGVRTYYPQPFPYIMLPVKRRIDSIAGRNMQLCFLNRYDNERQHLGWHADDAPEQDDAAPIIVQSFGAEREIWVRENDRNDTLEKIKLEHGSIFIMHPGMQRTHQHRIPKHPQPCGVRVSLTWRALK